MGFGNMMALKVVIYQKEKIKGGRLIIGGVRYTRNFYKLVNQLRYYFRRERYIDDVDPDLSQVTLVFDKI